MYTLTLPSTCLLDLSQWRGRHQVVTVLLLYSIYTLVLPSVVPIIPVVVERPLGSNCNATVQHVHSNLPSVMPIVPVAVESPPGSNRIVTVQYVHSDPPQFDAYCSGRGGEATRVLQPV
jgi:hypothetical protein